MKTMKIFVLVVFASSLFLSGYAQDIPVKENEDQKKMLSEKYKGKSYSPHAKRDFPNKILWGDTFQ